MTRRNLKKRCRRAVHTLCKRHGYRREDFFRSDGTETIGSPTGMRAREEERGVLHPGPMKGTLLICRRVSYEYNEWDCFLPTDILQDLEFDWERAYREIPWPESVEA